MEMERFELSSKQQHISKGTKVIQQLTFSEALGLESHSINLSYLIIGSDRAVVVLSYVYFKV